MFTVETQKVIDLAKDVALTQQRSELDVDAIAVTLAMHARGAAFLAACLGIDEAALSLRFPGPNGGLKQCSATMPLSDSCRHMLGKASTFATDIPMPRQTVLVALPHLVGAVAMSLKPEENFAVLDESDIVRLVEEWVANDAQPASLGELTQSMRELRRELLASVVGQDHAVDQFVEGLFSVEVVADDETRRKPAGIFVFAGPPGVGKTYLSELGARLHNRPYKRFDMSGYSQSHETGTLVGTPRLYKESQPGALTDFVQYNPNAILLFDEIEKAHHTVIQLFLQILDDGQLLDKHTDTEVKFRDTIIVFTTNVGRRLYGDENSAGVHQSNAGFHRSTVLDALRTELDPHTRAPFFPAAICSRIAAGHMVLFNRLRVDDLAQIAKSELERVGSMLESQHGQTYTFDDEIPLALVMREGPDSDARTIKGQAETFIKDEIFKSCQLFDDVHVDEAFQKIKRVTFEIDQKHAGPSANQLFQDDRRPNVLFVGDAALGQFHAQVLDKIDWHVASTSDQVFDVLAKHDIDLALFDLQMHGSAAPDYEDLADAFGDVSTGVSNVTELHFDHPPLAARRYAIGQQLLTALRKRLPDFPVYLYSGGDHSVARSAIDDELLVACVRAGGARGVVKVSLRSSDTADIELYRADLDARLQTIVCRLRRQNVATELSANSKVSVFETAPELTSDNTSLRIRCRNFKLTRAVRSRDANELISDTERPSTSFDDVVGAQSAKEALGFIRDWLKDPKKFAAIGITVPRGVLLTGPPGTGKTMLARALAGESECAFLSEAATGFVTKYQGSGTEAVRELFARARRYAPSIVFIDEIDAIGAARSSVTAGHVGHGEALTLNQLLVEMDGFGAPAARPVIVIAATNRVESLDPALMRRFSRTIEVELPSRSERELYLRRRLEAKSTHRVSDAVIERLAAQGQGLSIADYDRILAEATVMALSSDGVISDDTLGEAFEKVTIGDAKPTTDALRTARHESGHALVMAATGQPPIYVTIVGRGNFGGYAAIEDTEKRQSQTKSELEDHICQLLGGREAEHLYYGEDEGPSTGPSNDLERATRVAEAMVYDYGMSPAIGFVKIDRRRQLPEVLAVECHRAVQDIMEVQSKRASNLLRKYREGLDRTVAALMEHDRLLQHELLESLGLPAPTTSDNVAAK